MPRPVPSRRARLAQPLLLALIALTALLGCPRQQVVPDVPPVRTTSDATAQLRFDEAVSLYVQGRFPEAADAFRLFSAEFPEDTLALHAELYLGRALVAGGDSLGGVQVFRSLATAREDATIADLALVYQAFAHGVRGEFDASHAVLAELLDGAPSWRLPERWVIPGDLPLLGSLLAEAQLTAGHNLAAIFSLEAVAVDASDESLLFYAYDRAVEVAETRMSAVELEQAFDSGSVFARAVATTPLIAAQLALGDAGAARVTLELGSEALVMLELTDRLAAAQRLLDAAVSEGEARFGVVLSLTGPNRRAGRAALGGVLLAQRAFGDGVPAAIAFIRDTTHDADATANAVDELAALGVAAIIGPIEPELAEAAHAAARRHGLPMVSLSTEPHVEAGAEVYRLQLDAQTEAETLVRALWARGVTRFAVVRGADVAPAAYTEQLADAAERAIVDVGGELVASIGVSTEDAGLQAAAEDAAAVVAAQRPQGVLLALDEGPAAALGAWLAAENVWAAPRADVPPDGRIRVVLAASSLAAGPELLRNSARYFEGAIFPAWFVPGVGGAAAAGFATRFEATFGRPGTVLDAFAYDAAMLVRRLLIDEGRTTRRRVGEGLASLAGYDGVIGQIGFDRLGNLTAAPALCTVSAGAFAPLSP